MEPTSARTRVKRKPDRGNYDPDVVRAIVDEALICHVGIVAPDGHPVVIPTIHARVGDVLYVHGSPASGLLRLMKMKQTTSAVCVTVSILDGIVVARSAFNSSMNYRSVVVFGVPRLVEDREEKIAALEAVTNHVVPGRWVECRQVTEKEMTGTLVIALSLDEASAKIRVGGVVDKDEDYDQPIWAGVVPVSQTFGVPITDTRALPGTEVPQSVARLVNRQRS